MDVFRHGNTRTYVTETKGGGENALRPLGKGLLATAHSLVPGSQLQSRVFPGFEDKLSRTGPDFSAMECQATKFQHPFMGETAVELRPTNTTSPQRHKVSLT